VSRRRRACASRSAPHDSQPAAYALTRAPHSGHVVAPATASTLGSSPAMSLARHRPRVRRLARKTLLVSKRSVLEFVDDRGHRDAAQIAFFAVLSAVPLVMLLVGGLGLAFDDSEVRERTVEVLFDNVPLAEDSDRDGTEQAVRGALDNAGELGPISIVLLIVAATGVMGALRHSINQAWDIERRPPILKRKALDLALVLGATVTILFTLAISATERAERLLDDDEAAGWLLALVLDVVGDVLPFVFAVAVILFLYRVLPWPRPKVREIWPGAVVAAALIGVVREALDLYFEHLADFGALYGSLGALMALLLFVYAVANVLVFGAEFASEWSRVNDDERP
jgi:membrane protein